MGHTSPSVKKSRLSRKTIVWAIVGIVVVLIGYAIAHKKTKVYQYVPVTQGPITQTVSITGSTTPTSSVSLGFGNSGNIASVSAAVGKTVTKGQVLATLDTSDLSAQLKQAQANLAVAKANGQNTSVNVAEVQKQQDVLVANAYHTLLSSDLEAVANDPTTDVPPPTISGDYDGPQGDYEIHMYRSGAASGESFSLSGLESGFAEQAAVNPVPLGTHGLFIKFPAGLLADYGIETFTVSIPNTKSATYTANNNAYLAAQANRDTAIANAQAQITASSQGSSVSAAQIENAEAAVESAQAKFANTQIVAPIDGTITEFDAKVGQFATPGTTLVSIISDNSFEVDALASEIDIGKILVDNPVSMTLDAFPGETFTGKVFYIDPAQTTVSGVVGYKVKIAFDTVDPRMKSGLTANLTIQTNHKDTALLLPQYAILQNDNGTFVEVLQNNVVTDMPVTLGLQDSNGNVEIVSGVTAGEQVLNIGLKQS